MTSPLIIPLIQPVLIAVFLFGLGLLFCDLPFLADDYFYLWRGLTVPDLGWTDSYTFARMPVSTLLTQGVTKWGILERHPHWFVFSLFCIHATAFVLFVRALFRQAQIEIRPENRWLWSLLAAVFILQPNNYEIHLWHYCALHSIGALAVALAFSVRSRVAGVCALVFALLTYDSFFLMAAGAALLWGFARPKKAEYSRLAILVMVAISLGVATKMILKITSGSLQVIPFETSPFQILKNCTFVMREMFLIHFYKVNWPLTIAHLSALISTLWLAKKQNLYSAKRLLILALIPLATALPLALNSNPAPRSYYGPQLIQAAVLVLMLFQMAKSHALARKVIGVFSLIFAVQWVLIFKLKHENATKMRVTETGVIAQIRDCESPCLLRVPNPEEGLKRDFILPSCHWGIYYDRIRIKNFPEKRVEFKIEGENR